MSSSDDDDGHGTFIAGILVAIGQLGVQGVCLVSRPAAESPSTVRSPATARGGKAILYALARFQTANG